MTRTELVAEICRKNRHFSDKIVGRAINLILEQMTDTLNDGGRIEIRGFGSFCLHHWGPRHARHPVTGETWRTPSVYAVHFKPGKELRDRVNDAFIKGGSVITETVDLEEDAIA